MRYLTNPSTPAIRAAIEADPDRLGSMLSRGQGYSWATVPHAPWGADNECFTKGDRFDLDGYLDWLAGVPADMIELCLFATAPDVVGDHDATMARSRDVLPIIRDMGYPAAFVAQNGAHPDDMPWGDFDVLFIGGDTAWKLGPEAEQLARVAAAHGVPVHMGRVNSGKRLAYAAQIGCASADGTCLTFGPDKHLATLPRWFAGTAQGRLPLY